jgi:hypothetical protein
LIEPMGASEIVWLDVPGTRLAALRAEPSVNLVVARSPSRGGPGARIIV